MARYFLNHGASDEEMVFVARQPVVDRRGRAVAHELLFRNSDAATADITDDLLCTAAVVERVLGSIGLESLLEGKDAFLNCSAEFLNSDYVEVLPAKRFVLEVLESCELTPQLADRCNELRQIGFQIALDDIREITPSIRAFLPAVDIVKLDWPFVDSEQIGELIAELKGAKKTVLAEKIESRADRDIALKSGCDLFQGYYFAKPKIISARKTMPPIDAVLKIVALITDEVPQARIARALNDTPVLVAHLLRLANSSSQSRALRAQVSSVEQALAIAGSKKLLQWCCLLLYANPDGLPLEEDPLALLAQRRAAFMSQAVSSTTATNGPLEDIAFLTGMLSLMPVACGVDEKTFLDNIFVTDEIRSAILERHGVLGQLLTASEHLEGGDMHSAQSALSNGQAGEKPRKFPVYY